MVRILMIIIFVVAAALDPSPGHCAGRDTIPPQTVVKGQSITVPIEYEIGDAAVADPAVCDFIVSSDRRSLYVSGRGGGETTVSLWDVSGAKRDDVQVRVVTMTLKDLLDKTQGEFGEVCGVSVAVRGGRVEIRGEVSEPDDFRRIEGAARSDPRLKSRVRISGEVVGEEVSAIEKEIGVPGVSVRAVRDRVVLDGVAYSAADAKRAVEIAKLYSPEVLDLIEIRDAGRQVGRGRMIELSFHLMEVKRGALRSLGINWAPGSFPAGGPSTAGAGGGLASAFGEMGRGILGFVFNLVPKLRTLGERGEGRVLESPSIIVKSGEQAGIFSGSEVPYYRGEEIQFKKVGVEIEASPIETAEGIDLKLKATLTAPAADLRGAIDTNTVSTTALVRSGQSLILGNVVRNGDVKMKNRSPRDVDTSSALFTLFLSKDFQSNRSEFVIFVTPRIVEETKPAEAELREFLATEEAMIRDRSKKESAERAARHYGLESIKNESAARLKRPRVQRHRR